MMIIDQHVTQTGQQFSYCTEASTIGLHPGEWPERLETTLGNWQAFVRDHEERNAAGELEAVVYKQALGCITLVVFND
jgi:hypothetical protein